MTDALGNRDSVLVVGSTHEARALASRLADTFDVQFISDNRPLLEAAEADGLEAVYTSLDNGIDLAAVDLSADAAVVAATRDRTNLLVAQQLRTRGDVPRLVVRVNHPDRKAVFTPLGVETVCGTDVLAPAVRSSLEEA